jgi:hypothetical protein
LENGQNSDTVVVSANGSFTFPSRILSGGAYSIVINKQPTGQACTTNFTSGSIGSNVADLVVSCENLTIGGMIAGLSGTVTLQDNGGDSLTLNSSSGGTFTFPMALEQGSAYNVTVLTQPATQTCTVLNGMGTASGEINVGTVDVICMLSEYRLGGTVSGLTSADAGILGLALNGIENPIFADGSFQFPEFIEKGSSYSVTVLMQPIHQTCSVTNGAGTIESDISNVVVTCITNTSYTVGGTVNGLSAGGSLILTGSNEFGSILLPISSNGPFTFPYPFFQGDIYSVSTAGTSSTGQPCSVMNALGTIGTLNITNVQVNCQPIN